ncbi:MAG: DUF2071 domain-containing protein [Planctomycetes bacterium]|nr:DUF2071 domain-containing protein [Planctomycetota bacterium]
MPSFLQRHPFAVEAFFESSLVLAFAVPKDELQPLIPPRLELDTLHDTHAFLAVAMVETRDLRPRGFPRWLGQDFFLIGYRIFVRYTDPAGRRMRGLYILGSQTDKRRMAWFGNLFTRYQYSTIAVTDNTENGLRRIAAPRSGFEVTVATGPGDVPLPSHSPFCDWRETRRFAGPLPFTFTVDTQAREVLIIEGVRQHWIPTPVQVVAHRVPFLDALKLTGAVLANAFAVQHVPYMWKKGRVDRWDR